MAGAVAKLHTCRYFASYRPIRKLWKYPKVNAVGTCSREVVFYKTNTFQTSLNFWEFMRNFCKLYFVLNLFCVVTFQFVFFSVEQFSQ